MSFIPYFSILLLLCLSMHACIARHIGLVKIGGGVDQQPMDSVQGTDRGDDIIGNLDAAVMPQEPNLDSKFVSESSGQVPTIKPELVSVSWPMPRRGHEIFRSPSPSSSSLVVPLKATDVEGLTRRRGVQSVVRFGSNFKNAHKNEVQRDASDVIDYDPPHRTPPIHNKKIRD